METVIQKEECRGYTKSLAKLSLSAWYFENKVSQIRNKDYMLAFFAQLGATPCKPRVRCELYSASAPDTPWMCSFSL
jgi:hypothetical protein